MAITIGSAESASAGAVASVTVNIPGTSGDLLIAMVTWNATRTNSTVTSGWSEIFLDEAGDTLRNGVWAKVHSGSESTFTATNNSSGQLQAAVLAISGAELAGINTADAAYTPAYGNPPRISPSVTTSEAGCAVIRFCASPGLSDGGWEGAATQRAFTSNTHQTIYCADVQESAGAAGSQTVETDGTFTRWSARTFFITPTAASAPTISSVTLTGTSQIGNTLTATVVTDQDPVDSTTYQWEKASDGSGTGAADISGETASTLALTYADFGSLLDTAAYVRCGAIATKNALPSDEAFSAWQQVTVPTSAGLVSSPLKSPFLIA